MFLRVFSTCKQKIETTAHEKDQANTAKKNIQDEVHEILVIPLANTIIYPWTMVIHFENTCATF